MSSTNIIETDSQQWHRPWAGRGLSQHFLTYGPSPTSWAAHSGRGWDAHQNPWGAKATCLHPPGCSSGHISRGEGGCPRPPASAPWNQHSPGRNSAASSPSHFFPSVQAALGPVSRLPVPQGHRPQQAEREVGSEQGHVSSGPHPAWPSGHHTRLFATTHTPPPLPPTIQAPWSAMAALA